MRSLHLLLASAAAIAGTSAQAADELKFGKAPSWVVAQPIPASPAGSANAPVAVLLADQQVQLQPGKIATYTELAMRIQKPEGLSAGNVSIPWDPATDTVTVNKLEIHRGAQVIDVLAGGQKFTTMRRESGLEAAMIDGNLTANIQPEGLQEGDVLDLAMTVERVDPIMNGHVESNFAAGTGIEVRRSHLKVEWPASLKLNVQGKGLAIQPVTRGTTKVVEVTTENLEPIIPPKGAPARFSITRFGEATDFASWADVAKLMDPLFRKAEIIPSTGPLHDEVEKIRAASNDPTKRAEAALQLVQDRVRYVALLMGQGSYVPASAEETWSRRFGDCKAKTALLLGILHSLNIEAEPLLVQSKIGDAIAERLPLLSYFDHVLVRAHIDGKPYYLDGTRTGDTHLPDIEVPYFGWGLPVVNDAKLVALVPPARTTPDHERRVDVDATAGIYAAALITITEIFRGDSAVQLNAIYAALSTAQRDEVYRKNANEYFDGFQLTSSSTQFDKAKREFGITIKGNAKLNWRDSWFYVPTSSIAFTPDYARPPGPGHDAPIDVGYPSFAKDTAALKLPAGFAARQKLDAPVHETLAGVEYSRAETVNGDTLTVVSSERSVIPEVPYKDALAAAARLKALDSEDIYLRASAYELSSADTQALSGATPASASELIQRGVVYMDNGRLDDAIADFTKAESLEPTNALALANRSLAYIWKGDFSTAAQDIAAVEHADTAGAGALVLRAKGLIAERQARFDEAVAAYSQALALEPGNNFTLGHRSVAEHALGMDDAALADAALALKNTPAWKELRVLRAYTLLSQSKPDAAAAEAEQMIKDDPKSEYALISAGTILMKAGMSKRAIETFDRALTIKAQPSIYLGRALARPITDRDGRMKDFELALKLKPGDVDTLAEAAKGYACLGEFKRALALYDQLVVPTPGFSEYAIYRATILYKLGRTPEAEKLAANERKKARTATDFNNACWAKATAGVMLQSALEDCREALRLEPSKATYLDSLGMVLLKLGKLDEALSAFDQAIARGNGASSIMGRALVHARKGEQQLAKADAATALRLYPLIGETFAEEYGLRL